VKILNSVCSMQSGKFISASNISENRYEDSYPCYGGNGLRGYTSKFSHDGIYSLIGRQGALCGNVKLASGKFYATEHAIVVNTKEVINSSWLYYQLDFLNLNKHATGQAQPGLSVEVLENLKISAPENAEEQTKIASCLSSFDERIAAQVQKLDTLKAHKKGLMQQLFPVVSEAA
jgi:type I restriction enzyme, S subunit